MAGGGSNIKVLSVISVTRQLDAKQTSIDIPSGTLYAWLMVSLLSGSNVYHGNGIIPLTGTTVYIPFLCNDGTNTANVSLLVWIKADGTLYEYCSSKNNISCTTNIIFYGE